VISERVVAPREVRREGSQRQPTGVDARPPHRGLDRAHERAHRGLRAGERGSVTGSAFLARSTPAPSNVVAQRRGPRVQAALQLCGTDTRDVECGRRAALERDIGIDALERGIALRLPLTREREGEAPSVASP
jgi:hypothetical protein